MKKFIITFVLISILGICKGSVTANLPEQTVVAVNGLNLRESPSLKSKVIASIPFLGKVQLLSESESFKDTVGTVCFLDYNKYTYKQYILGDWVKVQYQKQEGYVFNAYLMEEYSEELLHNVDSQYALSFPGTNCYDNVHRNEDIRWKGVYKDGDMYEIRDVQLEYFMSMLDMDPHYGVTTQSNDSLLFMLGAVGKKFKNGIIEGNFRGYEMGFDLSKDSLTSESLTLQPMEDVVYITITEGDQQQKVKLHSSVFVQWKGDLDGDGKNDYIFTIGEESRSTNLYLSSEAEEGQLVKLVASYYSGDCC